MLQGAFYLQNYVLYIVSKKRKHANINPCRFYKILYQVFYCTKYYVVTCLALNKSFIPTTSIIEPKWAIFLVVVIFKNCFGSTHKAEKLLSIFCASFNLNFAFDLNLGGFGLFGPKMG